MSRRSLLCLVALFLFLVMPLMTRAALFPTPVAGTVLKSVSIKLWATQGDKTLASPLVVVDNEQFTIHWEAMGVNMSDETVSTGLTCRNNWGTQTGSSGSDTGSIRASREFKILCIGVGAGRSQWVTVNVGKVNLIVSSFSIQVPADKLVKDSTGKVIPSTYYSGVYNFSASIKNLGSPTVVTPFRVQITRDAIPTYSFTSASALKSIDMNGIGGLATKPLEGTNAMIIPPSGAGKFYLLMCADPDNVIPEANETNNCWVKGPFTFVAQ